MKKKLMIFSVALVMIGWIGTPAQRDQNIRPAKPDEIPFSYNANDYGKAEIEAVPKTVFDRNSTPVESPAHSCFHLEDKRPLPALDAGPRYFFPAYSTVCIIPLTDKSVTNYAKSYPYVHQAANKLRKLLAKRPARFNFNRELNDLPYNNSSGTVQSKLEYLDFKSGKGVLFLTQYSQDVQPSPLNNEELTCNFQGLTNDGKYYIAARLAITHPSLPKGIDSTKQPDPNRDYIKKEEQLLNSFSDESFQPSLKSLKALIASIRTN
jgi:hypothetical protein